MANADIHTAFVVVGTDVPEANVHTAFVVVATDVPEANIHTSFVVVATNVPETNIHTAFVVLAVEIEEEGGGGREFSGDFARVRAGLAGTFGNIQRRNV